jgi:hypothetical protein
MDEKQHFTKEDAPELNREQRRALEFDHPVPSDNPVEPPDLGDGGVSVAGRPDQDQTHTTGAGAGGAMEYEGRIPRHQGTQVTNSQKR